MNDQLKDRVINFFGIGSPLGGWYLSHVDAINHVLQTASLLVGLTVGLLTGIRFIYRWWKGKDNNAD